MYLKIPRKLQEGCRDLSISWKWRWILRKSGTQMYRRRNLLLLFAGRDSEVTDVRFLRKIDSFVSMWTST